MPPAPMIPTPRVSERRFIDCYRSVVPTRAYWTAKSSRRTVASCSSGASDDQRASLCGSAAMRSHAASKSPARLKANSTIRDGCPPPRPNHDAADGPVERGGCELEELVDRAASLAPGLGTRDGRPAVDERWGFGHVRCRGGERGTLAHSPRKAVHANSIALVLVRAR